MLQDDVNKMQQDLDAVRGALGCELPFNRDDIRLSLAFAAAAAFWFVWALFTGDDNRLIAIVPGGLPIVLLSIGGGIWLWRRWRARRKKQPLAAKEWTRGQIISHIVTLGMVSLIVIGRKMEIGTQQLGAIVFLGCAFSCLCIGLIGKAHRRSLIGVFLFGAMSPAIYFLYDYSHFVAIVAALTTLTMLLDVGIMYMQLRGSRGA